MFKLFNCFIGNCQFEEKTTEDLPFSSHVIKRDDKNLLGFQINGLQSKNDCDPNIRVNQIIIDKPEIMPELLTALMIVAKSIDCKVIRYADHLEPAIEAKMIEFGFKIESKDEHGNSFLVMKIGKERG